MMMNDFMVSDADLPGTVYSEITFAAFEDTGWYKVNYELAGNLIWGKNWGCEFLEEKCLRGREEFCEEPAEDHVMRCDFQHAFKGYCNLSKYSNPLPPEFQYFEDPA